MIQQHHGESNVRQRFTEYVQRFVRMAARYEEDQFRHTDIGFRSAPFSASTAALGSGVVPVDPGSWAKELDANASRIEGWRKTRSYKHYAADFAAQADGDLDFKVGDRIELVERTPNQEDWWTGRLNGRQGVFPGAWAVRLRWSEILI